MEYWNNGVTENRIDGGMKMDKGAAFGWEEETPEAKARWFQSLSLEERMDLFCEFTDLALAVTPRLFEEKDAAPVNLRHEP
jgi:hypothetical protein